MILDPTQIETLLKELRNICTVYELQLEAFVVKAGHLRIEGESGRDKTGAYAVSFTSDTQFDVTEDEGAGTPKPYPEEEKVIDAPKDVEPVDPV